MFFNLFCFFFSICRIDTKNFFSGQSSPTKSPSKRNISTQNLNFDVILNKIEDEGYPNAKALKVNLFKKNLFFFKSNL